MKLNQKPEVLKDFEMKRYLDDHIIEDGDVIYPKGLGLYLTSINKLKFKKYRQYAGKTTKHIYEFYIHPMKISDQAHRNYNFGFTWVAIGTAWYEKGKDLRKINTIEQVRMYAENTSKYQNVFLWGYPQPDSIDDFVKYMKDCTDINHVRGWILDPELGFKNEPEKARELVCKCREIDPYMILGMTTYGAAHWHRDFPYEAFKDVHFASPQVYNFSTKLKRRSFEEYEKLYKKIVPSIALYSKKEEGKGYTYKKIKNLRKEFLTTLKASNSIDSAILWQDAFSRVYQKETINEFAERIRLEGTK
jgi:hypothetical protein